MKCRRILISCFFLSVFLFFLTATLQTKQVNAAYASSFSQSWDCNSGFPADSCFREGCMTDRQLKMQNNQYTLKFNAPREAAYTCKITAVTNDFGFTCGSPPYNPSVAEPNEKTQVSLNGKIVGATDDNYCNLVSECVHPPCINSVPNDVSGLSDPACFSGLSDAKFCKHGSAEFKIGELIQSELDDAKAGEGDDVRYVLFVIGNTRSRASSSAIFVYYPEEKDWRIKTGVGTCIDCMCCRCYENEGDGWCGKGITRGESPTLEGERTYTITWDSDAHLICNQKQGEDARCWPTTTNSFEFNSYCLGNGCEGKTQWHNVWAQKFTNTPVTLESFTCYDYVYTASQSCPGFSNGWVYNGNCGGGSTLKACGASCTSGGECQSGTCTNYICYNCCGDGVCQANEEGSCRRDCGSGKECSRDEDCSDDEVCKAGNCRYLGK